MQEEQPAIYYMTGEKIAEMEREAALEVYKQKDLEVRPGGLDSLAPRAYKQQ